MAGKTLKRSDLPNKATEILYDWLQGRTETRYEIARRIGLSPSSCNQAISQYLRGNEIPPLRLTELSRQFPDFPLLEFMSASDRYKESPHLALAMETIKRVEAEYVTIAQNADLEISDRAYALALEEKLAEDRADDPDLDDPNYREICRKRRERNRKLFYAAMAKHERRTKMSAE